MSTLVYEDYAPAQFVREFTLRTEPTDAAKAFVSGLSPFDVPETVAVELLSDNQCIFRFTYPNSEPADVGRKVLPDRNVSIVLGKHTRKILEVHVSHARETLSRGNIDLGLPAFVELARTLPTQVAKASFRNSILIRAVLLQMPERFRLEMLARLADAWRTGGTTRG